MLLYFEQTNAADNTSVMTYKKCARFPWVQNYPPRDVPGHHGYSGKNKTWTKHVHQCLGHVLCSFIKCKNEHAQKGRYFGSFTSV